MSWELDPKFQIYYYIAQAKKVENGFFQNIRAIILPYLHEREWFLPDYALFSNKDFVYRLSLIRASSKIVNTDTVLYNYVQEKLDLYVIEEDLQAKREELEKVIHKLLQFIKATFPVSDRVKHIHIIPTKFGTGGSFFEEVNDDGSLELFITHRIDCSIDYLAKSIISGFVFSEESGDYSIYNNWMLRVGVIDFMFSHTRIRDLFPDADKLSVTGFLKEYKGYLAIESAQYYSRMGFPIKSCFSYLENTIVYNDNPLFGLDNKEIEVMKKLIDEHSRIVSFEDIAKVYWGEENWLDKFSLYSLAKVIEKLRKSMQRNNIPEHILMTVRKRGYLLYD